MDGTLPAAVTLGALWGPILVAGILAFVGSGLIWAALHLHDGDWKLVPDEVALQEALRSQGLAPGQYMFPHMDPKAPDRAASQRTWEGRYAQGPVGVLVLGRPGRMSMPRMLGGMLLWFLVVTFCIAYVASHALSFGAPYLTVFQVVGATAFLAYGAGQFPDSIWFYRSWRSTWITVFDALVYACLTAGVFGWLWPR